MSPQTVLTWGALDAAYSFILLIDDVGQCVIETSAGRVGPGWRLLVDQRTERTAQPGEMVAAMSREGRLIVGELAHDETDGTRYLWTGVARVPLADDGVRGTVVEYHPPVCSEGWVPR